MAARLPTQEEIEAKRRDLQEKIAVGKQAEQDLAKLEESVAAIAGLIGDVTGETFTIPLASPNVKVSVNTYRPKRAFSPLANMAEAVIRSYGAHHINDLMENMKAIGWESSGDHKLDYKNVYNCLAANKKFTNLGRNEWNLTENVKNKEESK